MAPISSATATPDPLDSSIKVPSQFTGWAAKGKDQALVKWSYEPRPLGPHDVDIRISHCGICATDTCTLDSGWGPSLYPCIVGHEIIGVVARVGPSVQTFRPGQRVGVGPQVYTCQECEDCQKGQENHCTKVNVLTYNSKYPDGAQAQGGYADFIRVHAHWVTHIPEALGSAEAAPLLCAGLTTYSPLREAGTGPGKSVGVVAIGGLGHIGIQWARAMGASKVTAISHSTSKKSDSFKLGATDFVATSNPEDIQSASYSLDILLVTSCGDYTDWTSLISLMRNGGKILLVAIPEKPISGIPAYLFLSRKLTLSGSAFGPPGMLSEMLQVAAKHNVRAWSEVRPMTQVNETLKDMRDGRARFRYVLENEEGDE